jgi:hyperosmotically inducible protein
MNNNTHRISTYLIAIALLSLSACSKPGPAEQAGRQLDEAAEKTAQALNRKIIQAENAAESEIQKADTSTTDADITAKVKIALMMRDGLNSMTISVKTVSGVVSLSGSVLNTSQFIMAQNLALAVDGVKGVDNKLAIVPKAN